MNFIYQTPKHKPETMSTSKLNNKQNSEILSFNFLKIIEIRKF